MLRRGVSFRKLWRSSQPFCLIPARSLSSNQSSLPPSSLSLGSLSLGRLYSQDARHVQHGRNAFEGETMERFFKGKEMTWERDTTGQGEGDKDKRGEDLLVSELRNGLTLATCKMPGSKGVATVGVWLRFGSALSGYRKDETLSEGLVHFMEHMTFKGTSKRTKAMLDQFVEDHGGHLNAYTTKEHVA